MRNFLVLFGLVVLMSLFSCQRLERERLVSNAVDTLLNEDKYVTEDEYEEDIARIRSEVDIKIDSLKRMMKENTTFSDNRFHMIVGSFRVPSNAQNYMEKMKSMGYNATIINNPNGLKMVSAQSYNNLRNAVTDIERFRQELEVSAWVYITG